jgi:hypothetical protein
MTTDYITIDQFVAFINEADSDLRFEPNMTLKDLIKCTRKNDEKENIEILDGIQAHYQFVIDSSKFEITFDANTGEVYKGPTNDKNEQCINVYFENNAIKTRYCDRYKSYFEKVKVQYYYKINKDKLQSLRDFLCDMMKNKIYRPIIDPDLQFNMVIDNGKKYSYFKFDGTDNQRGFSYKRHDSRSFDKKQEDIKELVEELNIPLYYSEKMNKIYTKSELEKAYGKMENKFAINWESMKYVYIFRAKIFILGGSIDALLNFNDFREKYMRPIYDNINDGNVKMWSDMQGNMAKIFRDLLWFENE